MPYRVLPETPVTTAYVASAVAAAVAGLSWKQAVRAATTAAGTLSTSFENGDVIDGVTLVTGNRILIKNQASPAENGIYVVAVSGAPTRASDADTGIELVNATVYVSEGTTLADTQWTCTANTTITLGSTSLPFAQISSGGGLTNWTDGISTSTPNATVPVVSFAATNAATDVDVVLKPKGSGAICARIADNTTTGGNKRGAYSVDWQPLSNASASDVASGGSATIGGGRENKASGDYSVVSGGQGNYATTTHAVVAGGYSNQSTAVKASVVGGESNTSSGSYSHIGGGSGNQASGNYSVIPGGAGNISDAAYSTIPGGKNASARGIYGSYAYASGVLSTQADAQYTRHVQRRVTTDATQTTLTNDGGTPTTANTVAMLFNSVYAFRTLISARRASNGDSAAFEITGAIKRGANTPGTTALLGTPTVTTLGADSGASSWAVAAAANTSNDALEIRVTGVASQTISWVAVTQISELRA